MAVRVRRQMPRFGRRRSSFLVPVGLIVIGVVGAALLSTPEPPLTGHPAVVDGDTLRLGGTRIRLLGIDAPELAQQCTDAAGGAWACGEAARRTMLALVGSDSADCTGEGHDRYGRILAHCSIGSADLGESMVKAGLAVSDGGYLIAEAEARNAGRGIWQGPFTQPTEWRRQESDNPASNWLDLIKSWLR